MDFESPEICESPGSRAAALAKDPRALDPLAHPRAPGAVGAIPDRGLTGASVLPGRLLLARPAA